MQVKSHELPGPQVQLLLRHSALHEGLFSLQSAAQLPQQVISQLLPGPQVQLLLRQLPLQEGLFDSQLSAQLVIDLHVIWQVAPSLQRHSLFAHSALHVVSASHVALQEPLGQVSAHEAQPSGHRQSLFEQVSWQHSPCWQTSHAWLHGLPPEDDDAPLELATAVELEDDALVTAVPPADDAEPPEPAAELAELTWASPPVPTPTLMRSPPAPVLEAPLVGQGALEVKSLPQASATEASSPIINVKRERNEKAITRRIPSGSGDKRSTKPSWDARAD